MYFGLWFYWPLFLYRRGLGVYMGTVAIYVCEVMHSACGLRLRFAVVVAAGLSFVICCICRALCSLTLHVAPPLHVRLLAGSMPVACTGSQLSAVLATVSRFSFLFTQLQAIISKPMITNPRSVDICGSHGRFCAPTDSDSWTNSTCWSWIWK